MCIANWVLPYNERMDNKKEQEPRVNGVEQIKPAEIPAENRENLETLSWMEKIEKRFARVPNDTSDVTDDSVVVQQPQAQQPPVTLPVNPKQMQVGKTAKIDTGIAWLVTWAIRQIKMITRMGGKVRLQDIPEVK